MSQLWLEPGVTGRAIRSREASGPARTTLGARLGPAGSPQAGGPLAAPVATVLELIVARPAAGPTSRGQEQTGPARARIARQSAEPAGRARALTPGLRVSVVPVVVVRARPLHLERADAGLPDRGVRTSATLRGSTGLSGRDPSPAVSYGVMPRAAIRLAAAPVAVALRSDQASRRAIRLNLPCPRTLMYGCSIHRCVLS
jgi:hypothetical protein